MVLFGCDWCKVIKQPGEVWVLGLAAESVGLTAARREVTILPVWDEGQSCHPLAVHFCSVEHKDNYLAALFETEPQPVESVVRSKTTVMPERTIQREYRRTASSGVVTMTTKKKRATKTRRSA
jgi:hypothetical protein